VLGSDRGNHLKNKMLVIHYSMTVLVILSGGFMCQIYATCNDWLQIYQTVFIGHLDILHKLPAVYSVTIQVFEEALDCWH